MHPNIVLPAGFQPLVIFFIKCRFHFVSQLINSSGNLVKQSPVLPLLRKTCLIRVS